MMTRKSIKINYIYHSGYQILNLLVPVITTPYISRKLQAEGIGAFSYTYSIVCYLIIFSNLGINAYASRKMAAIQDSLERQADLFWQIIGTKLVNIIIPSVIYGCVIVFSGRFQRLFLSEIFFFADGLFNISWYYIGMEDFKSTVRRSLAAKIMSVIMLFLLVRDEGDIIVYALIMGGTSFFSDLLLWSVLPKYIRKKKPVFKNYKEHLAGGIKMLMPELASSVFTYGDKVMLGILMISKSESGYYEQSQKIIMLSQGVINSIATVMLPRIANLYSKNEHEMVAYYMNRSIHFLLIIAMPIVFGIAGIANIFVPWFFGQGFESVETLLYILSPVVFIHGIYYIIGYQFMFGTEQETRLTVCILVGTLVNTVLNFLMIPAHGAAGASIASLISEIIISSVLLVYTRKMIGIGIMVKNGIKPFLASFVMFMVLYWMEQRMTPSFGSSFLLIGTGSVIYGIFMLVLRDNFFIEEVKKMRFRFIQK